MKKICYRHAFVMSCLSVFMLLIVTGIWSSDILGNKIISSVPTEADIQTRMQAQNLTRIADPVVSESISSTKSIHPELIPMPKKSDQDIFVRNDDWWPYEIQPPFGEFIDYNNPRGLFFGQARFSTAEGEPEFPEELKVSEPLGTVDGGCRTEIGKDSICH